VIDQLSNDSSENVNPDFPLRCVGTTSIHKLVCKGGGRGSVTNSSSLRSLTRGIGVRKWLI